MGISRFRRARPLHRTAGLIVAGALVLPLLGTSGCGSYIALSEARYVPQFDPTPLADYRGTTILMRGFENVDENTTIFVYPRSGPRRYGGPALTSYFWYCFRNAFNRLGVRVLEEGQAAPSTAVMDVKLVRLDEDGFTVDVSLMGASGQPPFQKRYSVPGPPLTALQEPALEARAYQMMTVLFWTIVADPPFHAIATGVPMSRSAMPIHL